MGTFNNFFKWVGFKKDDKVIISKTSKEKFLSDFENDLLFKTIARVSNDGIIISDPRGCVIFWNKASENILGYSSQEVFGKKIHQFLTPPEFQAEIHKQFRNFSKTGQGKYIGKTFEIRALHKNGHSLDIELSLSSIKLGSGWHAVGILRDITGRKNREIELINAKEVAEKSEAYYRMMITNSPNIIIIQDKTGKMTFVSPQIKSITGYDTEEVMEKGFSSELLHNEDFLLCKINAQNLLKGHDIKEFEYRFIKKDGDVLWLQHSASPIWYKNEIIGFQNNIRDITPQKTVELRLKESNTRYQTFFEQGFDGVVIIDPKTAKFIEFNKKACEQLGYSPEEFSKLSVFDIEARETPEQTRDTIRKTMIDGAMDFVTLQKTKQGELRDVQVSLRIIHILDEKVYHCIWRDISESKRAESVKLLNEKNLRNIADTMQETLSVISLDGTFLYANQKAAKNMSGGKTTYISGMKMQDFLHQNQAESLIKTYQSVYQSGKPFQQEIELCLEKENIWFFNTLKPIEFGNPPQPAILSVSLDITNQKLAEMELVKAKERAEISEERFNLAINASNDGLFDWNLETNEIYFSPGLKKILGYKDDEISNDFSVWKNLADPGDAIKAGEYQQKLISKQIDRLVLEFKMKHKFGHWVDILARAEAIFNNQGKALRINGTFTDITERKLIEKKLIASEEKYRLLAENSTDVIWVHDIESKKFLYVSPSVFQLRGFTAEEVMQQELTDVLTEQSLTYLVSMLPKQIAEYKKGLNNHFIAEIEQPCKDGSTVWTETTTRFDIDKTTGKLLLYGSGRNITKRKKAEEAAKLRDSYLTAIIENQPGLVWLKDTESRFLAVNTKFAISCGLNTPEQLVGKTDLDIWPEDLANIYRADDKKVISSKTGIIREEPINDKGSLKMFETFKTPVTNEFGKTIGTTGYAHDITERKLSEQKIISQNKEYELLNTELLQTNKEMYLAKQLAEESRRKLAVAQEIAKLGSWELDIRTGIFTFTDSFYSIFHTSAQMMGGYQMTIENYAKLFVHPDDASLVAIENQKALETRDPNYNNYLEHRIQYYDGGTGYISVKYFIIKDELGNTIKTYGVNQDITHLKLAEQELLNAKVKAELSEERFKLAMNASNDGIFDWNLETNEIYYSPGWKKMLGYEEHELPNNFSVWEKSTHPDDVKKSWELQQKLIAKQVDRFVIDIKMKHKMGHWVDVLARAEAFFDQNGKAIRIVGTHTDITGRKLAEKKLRTSEEKYRDLANSISVGIFEADLMGKVTFANTTLQQWVGISDPDFSNEIFAMDFVEPHQRETVMIRMKKIIEELKPQSYEYNLILYSGNSIPVYVTSVPIINEGKITGIRGTLMDISDRKKAEALIQEQAEQMKFILAATTDGFFKLDASGNIFDVNYLLANLLGYLPHELEQFPLHKLEAIESDKEVKLHIEKIIREGSGLFETRYFTHNGTLLDIEISTNFWPEKNQFLTFVRDISKRKKAEQELIDTKLRLQKAQTMAQVGNWELDFCNNKMWASDEAFRIYGISKINDENILPYDIVKLVPLIEYRQTLDKSLNDLLLGKKPYNIQFQISRFNDKTIRSIHSKAELLKDANNKPVKIIGVIQDITEQKLLENELRILSNAVEQNPTSIVITNPDGIIEYVNPKFTEITGYTFQEAKGNNPRLLKSGLTPESDYTDLWKTIKAGYIWTGEFCNKKKNGDLFWESATISPVYNSFSKITHFVAVKEDITEKKNSERQLLNASIEGQEQERNRFSRELHDGLGPLLSSIKLYFQWIAETDDPEKKSLFSTKGNYNINQAITTIREISNNLSPRALKTFGLIPALTDYLEGFNKNENQKIVFEANFNTRFHSTIELALYRIIFELFNNSLKHAKANQIQIILNYNNLSNELTLNYSDNGIGFDIEKALSQGKGHGMLNINNRVTSINGKISMQSHENSGIKIQIEVPDVYEMSGEET